MGGHVTYFQFFGFPPISAMAETVFVYAVCVVH